MFQNLPQLAKYITLGLMGFFSAWFGSTWAPIFTAYFTNLYLQLEGLQQDANVMGFLLWLDVANHWIPIGEFFLLLAAYWVFLGVFLIMKSFLKLIPTIG